MTVCSLLRRSGKNRLPSDEYIEISRMILSDILGDVITASTTAPRGLICQITDLNNSGLFKDGTLYPITDKSIIAINYKDLIVEKHKK